MTKKTVFETKEPPIQELSNPMTIMDQMQLLKGSPVIGIAISATGEDPLKDKITSIAFSAPNHPPFLIDMTQSRSEEVINFPKPLWEGPSEKVFCDAKKALNFFKIAGIEISGPIYDVMLADKILRAGEKDKKRVFNDIVMEYLGSAVSIDSTLPPIANVAAFLPKLREITITMLRENGLMDTATLEFECIRAVAEMERTGIRVNDKKLMEMLPELIRQKDYFMKSLYEKMGIINLNSRKEVMEAFHKQGIMVTDTRQETIHRLMMMSDLWILNYFYYKEVAYDISMAKGLLARINPNTGRLHPRYSQIGAATGRFSCSDPNLHAIPRKKEFRSCFIPADGHKLVIADYSQIELRIVAEISRDKRMIYAYKMGDDLHRLTAALVTGESIADVGKGKKSFAEVVNLGLIYGMEATKLTEYSLSNHGVTMTLEQAEKFRSEFFSAYQGIARWHEDVELRSGYQTRTLGNRRMLWLSYYTNNEDLLKAPVQGTAADILKKALCILHERTKGSYMRVIGCIHSEIITEAPIAEADAAAEILRESMIDAGKMYLKDVPVVVDVSIADNWSEK